MPDESHVKKPCSNHQHLLVQSHGSAFIFGDALEATCHIPVMDEGSYGIRVTFLDGRSLLAESELSVTAPVRHFRALNSVGGKKHGETVAQNVLKSC